MFLAAPIVGDPPGSSPEESQNVVLVSFSGWEHHLATDLELIQRHLDQGDAVTVLACLGRVGACRLNLDHTARICRRCISSRFEGFELLDDPDRRLRIERLVTAPDAETSEIAVQFTTVETAKEYEADGWDVGFAASSTAISAFRDHRLSSPESQDAWSRLVATGTQTYDSMRTYLSENTVDLVYVFNGRDVVARAVFRAAQHAGVDVAVHERGRGNDRFAVFTNALPHDREAFHQAILHAWDTSTDDRVTIGSEFYERSRAGKHGRWTSFVTAQDPGRLPSGWNPNRRNVVIFNSSEDEFAAIGPDWANPIYESQADGARQLAASLLDGSDIDLWLRMHPNLAMVDNASTQAFATLPEVGVKLIHSTSPIPTYALIDPADVVVTFGSTVGVESTYWGTPSVLLGHSMYGQLNATYRADDHEMAVDLIRTVDGPADRGDAIRYGYYLRSQGEPFCHYVASGFHDGHFNGHPVRQGETPFTFIAPALARLRIARPDLYRAVHGPLATVMHRPFAEAGRQRRAARAWAIDQPVLRQTWKAAKARGRELRASGSHPPIAAKESRS